MVFKNASPFFMGSSLWTKQHREKGAKHEMKIFDDAHDDVAYDGRVRRHGKNDGANECRNERRPGAPRSMARMFEGLNLTPEHWAKCAVWYRTDW